MDSLHGIKINNDIAAARGKSLTWDKRAKQLKLNGEALTPTFTTRAAAVKWAATINATVSAV